MTSLDTGLSLTAAYSYTHMKIIEGPDATIDNFVSSVPMHTASVYADYTLQADGAWSGLGFGGGVRFIGASYGNDENTLRNSARALVDAAVHYDFAALDPKYDGLRLQVNATNLFDRRDPVCSAGFCYRDQGRAVIGSLKYSW